MLLVHLLCFPLWSGLCKYLLSCWMKKITAFFMCILLLMILICLQFQYVLIQQKKILSLSVCGHESHSELSALFVYNGGGWSIKGGTCFRYDEWVCCWMMWVVPELLLCCFVHALIYFEYQLGQTGDRCTLTVLYIHGSSCRLLEACCPTSRPIGWNTKDTESFFESCAEIKLLEVKEERKKSVSFREVNSFVNCEELFFSSYNLCIFTFGNRSQGKIFWP